jgi:hypothetical protein
MCAHRKASLDDYFTNGKIIPGGGESIDFVMSKKQFQRLHKNFHFYIEQFELFNKKFEAFVCIKLIFYSHLFFSLNYLDR